MSSEWTVEELGRLWLAADSVHDMDMVAGFVKTKTAKECSEKLKKFISRQLLYTMDNNPKLNVK